MYPGGRASGHLDRLKVGETINVFAVGNRRRHAGRSLGLVAYGVGITEALPLAAAELAKGTQRVVLLWASRTAADMFWAAELGALRAKHGEAFELVTILSREVREGALKGRVDAGVLEAVFVSRLSLADAAARAEARFVSVGTKQMMAHTDALLAQIGCPMPEHALLRPPPPATTR